YCASTTSTCNLTPSQAATAPSSAPANPTITTAAAPPICTTTPPAGSGPPPKRCSKHGDSSSTKSASTAADYASLEPTSSPAATSTTRPIISFIAKPRTNCRIVSEPEAREQAKHLAKD